MAREYGVASQAAAIRSANAGPVTRPPNIKEVRTPMLDRLNREALETMGNEEESEEGVPEGLKKVVDDTGTN